MTEDLKQLFTTLKTSETAMTQLVQELTDLVVRERAINDEMAQQFETQLRTQDRIAVQAQEMFKNRYTVVRKGILYCIVPIGQGKAPEIKALAEVLAWVELAKRLIAEQEG